MPIFNNSCAVLSRIARVSEPKSVTLLDPARGLVRLSSREAYLFNDGHQSIRSFIRVRKNLFVSPSIATDCENPLGVVSGHILLRIVDPDGLEEHRTVAVMETLVPHIHLRDGDEVTDIDMDAIGGEYR